MSKKPLPTFEEAYHAWYAVADKYADFGASDTEPRSEFAEIIAALADGKEPVIPTRASGWRNGDPSWQLFSGEGMRGVGLVAAALTRAAKRAVAAGKLDHMGLMHIARRNGWVF